MQIIRVMERHVQPVLVSAISCHTSTAHLVSSRIADAFLKQMLLVRYGLTTLMGKASDTIGDTKTRIDFPYQCKKCGTYVPIHKRHEWQHACIPKTKIKEKWHGTVGKRHGGRRPDCRRSMLT